MTLTPDTATAFTPEALLTIAAQITPAPAGWDMPLTEAGFDSLARLELAVRVEEKLRRPVPDSVLVQARTLHDLHALLAR